MKRIACSLSISLVMLFFAGCKKNNESNYIAPENYVISIAPWGQQYPISRPLFLQAKNLDTGTLSLINNQIGYESVRSYYSAEENQTFDVLLGYESPWQQSVFSPDAVSRPVSISNGSFTYVNQVAKFGNEAILADLTARVDPRGIITPGANLIYLKADDVVKESLLETRELMQNRGMAWMNGFAVHDKKLFASLASILNVNEWITNHPDSAWIAVFSLPDLKLERVLRDDRTGLIGSRYASGLAVADDGYIYAFSSPDAIEVNGQPSTAPAAITRLRLNGSDFDRSYHFNISAASGGAYIGSWTFVGNGYVLAEMKTENTATGNRLAVINLAKKTFKWVSGLPGAEQIQAIAPARNMKGGNAIYTGISTHDNKSFIYKIDLSSAKAIKGANITAGNIAGLYAF